MPRGRVNAGQTGVKISQCSPRTHAGYPCPQSRAALSKVNGEAWRRRSQRPRSSREKRAALGTRARDAVSEWESVLVKPHHGQARGPRCSI